MTETAIIRRERGDPWYYARDDGCQHSEGEGCLECPWHRCIETLACSRKKLFFRDLERDGAVDWRRKDG